MTLLADILLAPTEAAPARARQVVREALTTDVSQEVRDDTLIVVSELVTFKVLDGRIGPDEFIGLKVWREGTIRVEVRGAGAPRPANWSGQPWAPVDALLSRMTAGSGLTHSDRIVAWADVAL